MTSMRAIQAHSSDTVRLVEMPKPIPAPGQVRIRTAHCGICATDISIIHGSDRVAFPFVPGHEWSGRVDAAGRSGDEYLVGTRCVGSNILSDGLEVGFEYPGGYGEYFLTDASNVHVLPDSLDLLTSILIEPLAVCVRGFHRLKPEPDSPILIFGDGPIGLLMITLLRAYGYNSIVIIGGRSHRLAAARSLGANLTLSYHDSHTKNLADYITQEITSHENPAGKDTPTARNADSRIVKNRKSFPAIIEATGTPEAIRALWPLSGHDSRVLLMGDYQNVTEPVEWQMMLHKEISLIPSNASEGGWHEAIRVAEDMKDLIHPIISHLYDAQSEETVQAGLFATRSATHGLIKAAFVWEENQETR
jgi:threonine dehydrogenase-like Zn-dependent dehydrogenase